MSGTTPKPNTLLFVGGLSDGIGSTPYLSDLAESLDKTSWSLFQPVLSSSYLGWGIGSLDKDVTEIGQCVDYIREYKNAKYGAGKVVLIGHSTGSQDVLHYLHATNPTGAIPTDAELTKRPSVDGAILQAPVSDREAMRNALKLGFMGRSPEKLQALYNELITLARQQTSQSEAPEALLPLHMTRELGYGPTALTSRRFLSLTSPDSPASPREDDLFSSDLSDARLRQTFGRAKDNGLLTSKLLVLVSGQDHSYADDLDKVAMIQRWKDATNANEGGDAWDERSGVIEGASHTMGWEGDDEPRKNFISRINGYLGSVEGSG